MRTSLHFDTHAFVEAFVNAKTEEAKAEVLAETMVRIDEKTSSKVDHRFDKAKDELVTKLYLDNKIKDIDIRIKNLQIKIYLALGGLCAFLTTVMLTILPLMLKR